MPATLRGASPRRAAVGALSLEARCTNPSPTGNPRPRTHASVSRSPYLAASRYQLYTVDGSTPAVRPDHMASRAARVARHSAAAARSAVWRGTPLAPSGSNPTRTACHTARGRQCRPSAYVRPIGATATAATSPPACSVMAAATAAAAAALPSPPPPFHCHRRAVTSAVTAATSRPASSCSRPQQAAQPDHSPQLLLGRPALPLVRHPRHDPLHDLHAAGRPPAQPAT